MTRRPAQLACIGLGSNLDGPARQILRAFEALAACPGIVVVARSRLYRSAPWGRAEQPDFVNAAVEIETALTPRELLRELLAIERRLGRVRDGDSRWGPRVIDIDLLTYGDRVIDEAGLRIPHPHLHERAFVLLPLNDLGAQRIIPGSGTVAGLLGRIDSSGCTVVADGTNGRDPQS